MYKKECEGSFTIEAAFVVPVVLSVMCILIWLTMFMHDASVTYSKLLIGNMCSWLSVRCLQNLMEIAVKAAQLLHHH